MIGGKRAHNRRGGPFRKKKEEISTKAKLGEKKEKVPVEKRPT